MVLVSLPCDFFLGPQAGKGVVTNRQLPCELSLLSPIPPAECLVIALETEDGKELSLQTTPVRETLAHLKAVQSLQPESKLCPQSLRLLAQSEGGHTADKMRPLSPVPLAGWTAAAALR